MVIHTRFEKDILVKLLKITFLLFLWVVCVLCVPKIGVHIHDPIFSVCMENYTANEE